ncbi:hypothetical protein GEMRC1_003144 [Eukaryota sp. GEM-RC1]
MDILQMLGRAGRPAFDTTGLGILITEHHNLMLYLSLLNQQMPVESQLISKLPDVLNAEVVLGSVGSKREAVEWLKGTYLAVRVGKVPVVYEVPGDVSCEMFLENLVDQALTLLEKYGLIMIDHDQDKLAFSELGRVAAHFYIDYESVKTFNSLITPDMSTIDAFRIFSFSGEFKNLVVRNEELVELEKLLELCPIPVRESIEGSSAKNAKINILLQAYISNLPLSGLAINADMMYVHQSAGRLFRALFSISLHRKWAKAALLLLDLCKSIDHKCWYVETPLRQFPAIPETILLRLEQGGVPFDQFVELSEEQLGELMRGVKIRDQKVGGLSVGKRVKSYIRFIPRMSVQASVQPISPSSIRIDLSMIADFDWTDDIHGRAEPFWIFVCDSDEETLVHSEFYVLSKRFSNSEAMFSFKVLLLRPLSPNYFVHIISDRWLGSKSVITLSFRSLLIPEKFPTFSTWENVGLVPTKAVNLNFKKCWNSVCDAQKFFGFEYFNSLQSQCFSSVFTNNSSFFFSGPSGTGKTSIADLAILNMLNNFDIDNVQNCRIVYLLDSREIPSKLAHLRPIADLFSITITALTGDVTADVSINLPNILLASPRQYCLIASRWQKRSSWSEIDL